MKALAKLFDILPGWVWAMICAGLVGFGAVQSLRVADFRVKLADSKIVSSALKVDIEQLQADSAKQRAKDEADARERERQLIEYQAQKERQKDEQIDRLRRDVRTLRGRLQQLPERPARAPEQNIGQGGAAAPDQASTFQCDGPVIYREDGQLLVDEAERAEAIRIELLNLYDLYDKARALKQQ